MENWENNIIAEKLNGLQDLPEGYLPNLASKWEIIEAGLPQQKKVLLPLFKWAAVAATIIGVIICSLLFKSSKNNFPIAIKNPINKTTTAIANTTIKSPEKIFNLISVNPPIKTKKVTADNNPKNKTAINILAKKTISINDPIVLNSTPVKTIDNASAIKAPIISVNNTEIAKNSKPKIYQKDFGNDIFTMDTGKIITQNKPTGFKIQLNNNRDNNSGESSSPVLQLQKSF